MRLSRSLSLAVAVGLLSVGSVALSQPAALADRIVGTLTLGQTVNDQLSGTEPTDPTRYQAYDGWAFTGTAGQYVEIFLASDDYDTYLQLEDPTGAVIASDDDSGGNLDSRIRVALPTSGTYVIQASSYAGGVGNYSLTVREPSVAPLQLGAAEIGETYPGIIDANDYSTQYNGNAEAWDIELAAGQRFTASVTSNDMATWIRILSPAGELIQEMSSYTLGVPATASTTTTASGVYRVVVSAADASSYGAYSLTLTDGVAPAPVGGMLELGEETEGTISATDNVNAGGLASDSYGLELERGDVVAITMIGNGFDPYLTVYSPEGNWIASDDDGAGNLNSRVTFTAVVDGIHRVEPSTYSGSYGSYTIEAIRPERGAPDVEEIEVGDTVNARLEAGDGLSVWGSSYLDVYELEVDDGDNFAVSILGGSGATVSVSLIAPTFETYSSTSNDPYYAVPGEVTNAIGGTWRLVVTTYSLVETDYTLSISDAAYSNLPELELDETASGTLNDSDGRSSTSGGLSDEYVLEIEEPGVYEITLSTTNGSDAYLEIASSDYLVSTSTGDYASSTATIRYFLPVGTYRVSASSAYGLDGTGYTLLAKEGQAVALRTRELLIGQPVTVGAGDVAMGAFNTNIVAFYFDGTMGQTVTFDFSGAYGYSTLNSPIGDWVQSGYDDGTMTYTTMTATLPASGRYYVQFTPYGSLSSPLTVSVR